MPNKKVLVTGATGLLGSNVAAELVERGYEVRVLTRKTSNTISIADLPVENYVGDITQPESVRQAVRGCQVVIHAAANTSQWGAEMNKHNAVNVLGTKHVLEAVQALDVERFIYVSTANTLAPGSLEQPGDENGAFSYQELSTRYIDTKYQAEQMVLQAVTEQGTPAVIVNPTFIIGARDAKPSSGKMILFYLQNQLIASPPGGKNYVPVQDAAVAVANAITLGQPGERYLLAGENMRYADFFNKIAKVTGRRKPVFTTPAPVLRAVGRVGDAVQRITRQTVSWNYANVSMLTIENYYTGAKAVAELQMPQTPIEEAIEDAVSWFAGNEYV